VIIGQLGWLTGGTWIAESKTPAGGPEQMEAVYTWTSGGKAIKYKLVRRAGGKVVPAMEGIMAWHPGKKSLGEVTHTVERDGQWGPVFEKTFKRAQGGE